MKRYPSYSLRGLGQTPEASTADEVDTLVVEVETGATTTEQTQGNAPEVIQIEVPVSSTNGYTDLGTLRASMPEGDLDFDEIFEKVRAAGFSNIVESHARFNFEYLKTDTSFETFLRKEATGIKFACALEFSYSQDAQKLFGLNFGSVGEFKETIGVLYFDEVISATETTDDSGNITSNLVMPLTTEGLTLETVASNNDFSLLNTLTADVVRISFGQALADVQTIDMFKARELGALCIGYMMSKEDQKGVLLEIIENIMGSIEFAKHLLGFNIREKDIFSILTEAANGLLVELVPHSIVESSPIAKEPSVAELSDKSIYVSKSPELTTEELSATLIGTFNKIFEAIASAMKDSVIDNLRLSSIDIFGRLAKFQSNYTAAFVNIKTLYNTIASDDDKKSMLPLFKGTEEEIGELNRFLNSSLSQSFSSMYSVSDFNTDLRKLIKLGKVGDSTFTASYSPSFQNLMITTAHLVLKEFKGDEEATNAKFNEELKKRVRQHINNELNNVFTLMEDSRANAAYVQSLIDELLLSLERVEPVNDAMASFKQSTLNSTVYPVCNNFREITDRFMVACDDFSSVAEESEKDFLISIGQIESAARMAGQAKRSLSPTVKGILYSLAGAAVGYGVKTIMTSKSNK